MDTITRTTTGLLADLHDPTNDAAWRAFDARYRPILHRVVRRLGLTDDDASDLAQEVMARFVELYREHRYDRDKGRLRSWLASIVRRRAIDFMRARAVRGEGPLPDQCEQDEIERFFEVERRQAVLSEALEELRDSGASDRDTHAFELLALREMEPGVVAEQLGMKIDEVYRAKYRVIQKLRPVISRIEAAYSED